MMSLNKKNPPNNYLKYSSIAFQMAIIIFGSTFGGVKLDEYLKWNFPIFTLVFSILGVVLAIYFSIRDFIKMDK